MVFVFVYFLLFWGYRRLDWIVASQLDWRCCMSKEELSQPSPCFFLSQVVVEVGERRRSVTRSWKSPTLRNLREVFDR